MIICHVTSMHDWKDDRIFERACVGLADSGVKTIYIASPEMKHYVSDLGQTNNEAYTDIKGVRIYWIKQRKGWRRRLYSSMEATKLAEQLNPDIIHFHDPDLMPWMYGLARKGKKVIYDIHENYASRMEKLSFLPAFARNQLAKLYRRFENFYINRYAGAVVVTEALKDLINCKNKNVLTIGNLPYLKLLSEIKLSSETFNETTIVTSGTINPSRNGVETICAIPFLQKAKDEVKFLFAGKYAKGYEEAIEAKAKEFSAENMVRTEGMLPYLENFQRISKAHIGCVFYEDNPNNRIGLPNRIFEYMYCGLAILGDNYPEIKRVVDKAQCGIVTDSTNPKQLAEAIEQLVGNKAALKQMGEKAKRAVIEEYNFEKALERMIDFYHGLLANKNEAVPA